jgi:hypothetical protein
MKIRIRLSYVQIAIILVVLVVVARTVAPRFSEAGVESKVSLLVDGLEEMRSHLDLYRAQHEGCLPPTDSFGLFEVAMTSRIQDYGPYVKKIPVNPFNNLNTVRFDREPAGSNKAGWRLDTKTGLVQADNDAGYAAL